MESILLPCFHIYIYTFVFIIVEASKLKMASASLELRGPEEGGRYHREEWWGFSEMLSLTGK